VVGEAHEGQRLGREAGRAAPLQAWIAQGLGRGSPLSTWTLPLALGAGLWLRGSHTLVLCVCVCVCVVLGFELMAFTLSHSSNPILVKRFLRYGLTELFAQAGFEPRSS
jgi:hypothetical protein